MHSAYVHVHHGSAVNTVSSWGMCLITRVDAEVHNTGRLQVNISPVNREEMEALRVDICIV